MVTSKQLLLCTFLFHTYLRYCQKLPHDVYTKVQPHFTVKKVPRRYHSLYFVDSDDTHTPAYVCTVTLPLPCPYREPIQVSLTELPPSHTHTHTRTHMHMHAHTHTYTHTHTHTHTLCSVITAGCGVYRDRKWRPADKLNEQLH